VHESVVHLIESYGYWIVFGFVAIESLGIPLPGETILVTAGALAAVGHLSLAAVIATASAGAILGDGSGYWIGRIGGLRLLRRYGRLLHVDESKLDRVRAFFSRHGPKAVFFGRFVALLRTWTAILAGTAEMPYRVFTFYNVLGGVIWAALFGALGFAFGQSLPLLQHYVAQATLAAVLLVTIAAGMAVAWKWFDRNRDEVLEFGDMQWARIAARFPKSSRFVSARFARGEYLGLHLTIGFVLSVAGLWLFSGITEDIIHHDPLTRFDLAMLTWIRARSTPAGDRLFQVVAYVGSPVAMAAIAIFGTVVIAVRRDWIVLTGWFAAFAGSSTLVAILKNLIRRPRPFGASAFLSGDSLSFPSGHVLGSFVGYGMLAYVIGSFWASSRRTRTVLTLGAGLLVILIGVSRLYLGVHYFSDVIGGYAAGILWLCVCVSAVEVVKRKRSTEQIGDEMKEHFAAASVSSL
jgi:membrane protein DedA with SNARE-associated domain/membrane-associated phospholipid phosphatase